MLEERLYQRDAHRAWAVHANVTFALLLPLLGKSANSSFVREYINKFGLSELFWIWNNTEAQLRARVPAKDRESSYSIEELLAMVLREAKKSVTRFAQEDVSNCVMAVPPQFGTSERLALLGALKLARLVPLGFVNQNLAAAIKYAIDGAAKEAMEKRGYSTVMYVNLGATSFKVSVVNHSVSTVAGKRTDSVHTLGEAWDELLGGRQFDFVLANIVAEKFNAASEQNGKPDIRLNAVAMRRIVEKAEEAKERLSVANASRISIDHLLGDTNLDAEITREEFEAGLAQFGPRIQGTILRALADAGIPVGAIDDVELIGGGLRAPGVQEMITNALNV